MTSPLSWTVLTTPTRPIYCSKMQSKCSSMNVLTTHIIGGERERAPNCSFSRSLSDRVSVCPCVHLSGWNIMGMHGERNTWLSCFIAHAQHNTARTTNMDRRGSRAQEGSVQHACRRLERDREPVRQRRQQ